MALKVLILGMIGILFLKGYQSQLILKSSLKI